MLGESPEFAVRSEELAALRLMQAMVFARDLAATDLEQRSVKSSHLHSFMRDVVVWSRTVNLEHIVEPVATDPTLARCHSALELVSGGVRPSVARRLIIDVLADASLPKGSKWAVSVDEAASEAMRSLGLHWWSERRARLVRRKFNKALKRLSVDSASPVLRVGLLAGAVALTVASGGIATAVGTAIGGTMGLSGAAATSAGLAWLGGGSIAAGGLGMAGGTLLVVGTSKVGYMGTRYLATSLATRSPDAFIRELAKLQIVVEQDPELRRSVLKSLIKIRSELDLGSAEVEGKNVAKARRALDATIRVLKDSKTQSRLRIVSRAAPIPGLNGRIDRMR